MTVGAMQPFPWYGSKVTKQSFIQPRLPETKTTVVPYGGSGSVLLNREQSGVEVFNDIDGDVVAFFEVLRDRPAELIDKLRKTPYHEGMFEEYNARLKAGDHSSKMDQAICFFVASTMSYNAQSNAFSFSKSEARRGMAQHTSRYRTKIEELEEVADRLHHIQFLNRDALSVVERFDQPDTLQYVDPPYPHDVRKDSDSYNYEMTDEEHLELLDAARGNEAHIAISSYKNPLYEEELGDGWYRYDSASKGTGATNSGTTKQEVLYANYELPDMEPVEVGT